MEKERGLECGIRSLIEGYRDAFSIPENREYYLDEDYKSAEKKFIRYALSNGRVGYLRKGI